MPQMLSGLLQNAEACELTEEVCFLRRQKCLNKVKRRKYLSGLQQAKVRFAAVN